MRAMIVVGAMLLSTSGPLFAQSRGYVELGGGIAASPDATSGNVVGEAGVRVAPSLFVFGDVGQFHNLQPSLVQPTVDLTDALLAVNGVALTGTARVPAWYSLGGIRYVAQAHSGVAPYVLAGAGVARLTPAAQFTYQSGPLGDAPPSAGADVTSQLVTLGDFAQPAASTAFMIAAGGGVEVPVAPHVTVDVGYRLSRINTDTPLVAHSVVAAVGYRF